MKFILTILLVVVSINAFAEMSDSELRNALIGSWVKSSDDSSYNEYGFITEYKTDGTTVHRDYASKNCKVLEAITTGKWSIESGYLTNTVETSKGEYPLPIGAVVTDRIMSIDETFKVLKTKSGKTLLRTKSTKCV